MDWLTDLKVLPRRVCVAGPLLWLVACGNTPLHPFILAQQRPIVFAHRGGGGTEPEATLPTMLATHGRNPRAVIEFDVHRSKDGQIMVIHDATVDRTTNGTGLVADMTLTQLKALDAGYCSTPNEGNGTAEPGECGAGEPDRFPFRGKGYQVPTLQEALSVLPAEVFISIEVKQPGLEHQVATVLRASGRLSKLIVGAEFDDMAIRIKDALPEVPGYLPVGAATCFVLSAKARWDYPACPMYEVFASPLTGAGLALDTRAVISTAHREGMAIVYWTINDEPTMERLFRVGADGIFTDYPDRARAVLDRMRAIGVLE